MNRLFASASLFLGALVVSACSTVPADADALPGRLDDAGIVRHPGVAGAEGPVDPARDRLDRLTADAVKTLYLACSDAAAERRIGGGEVAYCSTVYDVLLNRHFGGNFDTLLAWSRQQTHAMSETGPARAETGGAAAGAAGIQPPQRDGGS